jgi:hypothetical protein
MDKKKKDLNKNMEKHRKLPRLKGGLEKPIHCVLSK